MTNEIIAEKVMQIGKRSKVCIVDGFESDVVFENNLLCTMCSGYEGEVSNCSLADNPYKLPDLCPHWQERWYITDVLPDFLNDMNAAMMVVEKMKAFGYLWQFYNPIDGERDSSLWYAHVDNPETFQDVAEANNMSLPTAICEAALKAMEAS